MPRAPYRPTPDEIEAALVEHRSIWAAADALGVNKVSLRDWMVIDGIPSPAERGWPRVLRVTGREAGVHSKPRADRQAEQAPPTPRVDRDSAFADLSHALMLTGGRWRDLAALAAKHGMTVRQMQQRWFQLRLPVQKAVR
jgi:hypothetical protein